MKYYVSRQHYWPDGNFAVEIVSGGSDYANPGQLVSRFSNLGEGKEFINPREAVEAAINIATEWRKITENTIEITHGSTFGFTMPLESSSEEELKKWADATYEKLPKCSRCAELLGNKKYSHDFSDDEFCSEYCAEEDYNSNSCNE